ncbi:MAG: hypothetical protein FJ214_02425 [Ignavibacteria bacterium]|nr:hypothetical protein [Ignavibacteria bacterium]
MLKRKQILSISRLVLIHYIVLLAITVFHQHSHSFYSSNMEFFQPENNSTEAHGPFSDGKSGCLIAQFAGTSFENQPYFHNYLFSEFTKYIPVYQTPIVISKLFSLSQLRAPPAYLLS